MTTLTVNSVPLKVNSWLFAQYITLLLQLNTPPFLAYNTAFLKSYECIIFIFFFYIPRPFLLLPSPFFPPSVQETDSQKYKIQQKGRLDCASFFNSIIQKDATPSLYHVQLYVLFGSSTHTHCTSIYIGRKNISQDFIFILLLSGSCHNGDACSMKAVLANLHQILMLFIDSLTYALCRLSWLNLKTMFFLKSHQKSVESVRFFLKIEESFYNTNT